ncbi:ATP-binding protein [Leptolyngbya sp. ST-U4]|uniref:ATP-binding protein n=1 Tax=Leptolyngbya sp. ST-U4 TaxID=2933912 RepID=UPI0032988FF4
MDTASISNNLFANGGEMGRLMRQMDWSKTPLGEVETWSQSLKTTLRIVLTSRQPMFVWWGEDLINLYNDAYRDFLHAKHPAALGQSATEVWREVWDQLEPRIESVIHKNEGTFDEALPFIMERKGYPEETYVTFSYSPIPGDREDIGGLLCACTDDTQRIVGERQLALLRELAAKTADARTFDQACSLSIEALYSNPYDLPFAMIYLVDPDQQQIVLAGTSGIDPGHPAVLQTADLDSPSAWSLAEVLATQKNVLIRDLTARWSHLPTGAWERPPHQAVAVPIAPSGQTGRAGVLVVGLNPLRLFDDSYQGFINLVAGQIAASIANAQAYEEERKRAEALAEIDRAKTVFFSNVSHEFRTPLTLMLAPAEDALNDPDEPLSSNQQERIQTVQRNGMRLLKLVNTLLDFSRIEAGRVQASYEPTDLATFTAELASVFRSVIERAGMRLLVDCPPLPEWVYVDREMWEKVVFNLLSNALKFTFAGEIAVSLQWQHDHVELQVRDTGIGIPAAELPHLFERFHRVKGAQGRSFEGSGIGLSLVQELVKLHGGTIAVRSIEGQGTCFTLSVPTGTAHLPSERLQHSEADRLSAARTLVSTALNSNPYLEEALRWLSEVSTGNESVITLSPPLSTASLPIPPSSLSPAAAARILLADDNADMRDYVRRLLSQQYEVKAVPDGALALAAIRQQPPDLVLTDVMMPNLDGFGLLQALRTDPQTREIPIILLSARAGEEARIEGLEAGADDYLVKPFSARELLARVEATLKLAQLRREVSQTLERSEERYRAFVQQSSEGIWRFEVEQPIEIDRPEAEQLECFYQHAYLAECNQRFAEMYGVASPQDLIGARLTDFFAPADSRNLEYLRAFIRGGFRLSDAESYEVDQQGNPKIFLNNLIGIIENRKLVRVWGTQRDITARKQAELEREALLARERHYVNQSQELTIAALSINSALSMQEVLQVVTDQAAAIIGAHQSVTSLTINQNWAQAITAVSLSEKYAQWRDYNELTNGTGIYACVCHLNRPLRMTQAELEAHPHWKGFGEAVDRHPPMRGWLAAPLIGRNGQNIGLLQLSDKYEGEFTETDESILVQLAQMASIAIENTRLYEAEQQARSNAEMAREEAQAANRIKDEFLAVLSHELRSPLNPILGWARLLQTGKLDAAKTFQALSTIERNAKLQAELIEDLLDVSRILQGKLSLNVSPINLAATVQSAIETVRLAAEAKSISVAAHLDTEVGQVFGDATRLQQVVWNLLSNAVKFTPAGGQVEVRLEPVDGQAQITVRDSGKGIPSNFLPYVFDYFRQEDGATTRKFGGLGLGLAIVRHLVELHGGTVKVESEGEGLGAMFTVKLPLMSSSPTASSDRPLTESSLNLNGIQVLVIDDGIDSREFVTFVLEQAGATVATASTASEGFLMFTQSPPDMLLSDIGMPDMDGYMLMQQIRSLPLEQGGQVPAIALTAYAGEINYQQAMAAGYQRHLSKPIEPENLVQTVAELLQS